MIWREDGKLKGHYQFLAIVHAGVKPHFGFPHLKIHWTSPDKDDALLNNLENVQGDEEDYFGGSSQCIIKIQNLQKQNSNFNLVSA